MEKAGELTVIPEEGSTTYKYIWKLGDNLENLENAMVSSGQSNLHTNIITFDSGILKDTEHAIKFYILLVDGPQLFAKMFMKPPPIKEPYTHSKIEVTDLSGLLESSWRVLSKANKNGLPRCLTKADGGMSNGSQVTWWKSRKIGFTKGVVQITFRLNVKYAYWDSVGPETVPCLVPERATRRKSHVSGEENSPAAKKGAESLARTSESVPDKKESTKRLLKTSLPLQKVTAETGTAKTLAKGVDNCANKLSKCKIGSTASLPANSAQ